MDISQSREGRTGVLALSGPLDTMRAPGAGPGASLQALLFDLSGVPYVTSAGFRALLVVKQRAEPAGIGLALCGFNGVVAELFEASAFDSIFRIYPDRAGALLAIGETNAAE